MISKVTQDMVAAGWTAVTFKQAYRELRMRIEELQWQEEYVNPNLYIMYEYYNERIANGAESYIAHYISKGVRK